MRSDQIVYPKPRFSSLLNIPVTPPMKATLREIANLRQLTVSDIVREALLQYMTNNQDYNNMHYLKEREYAQQTQKEQ